MLSSQLENYTMNLRMYVNVGRWAGTANGPYSGVLADHRYTERRSRGTPSAYPVVLRDPLLHMGELATVVWA